MKPEPLQDGLQNSNSPHKQTIGLKDSLATYLVRVVFLIYFVVTLIVTLVQLYSEFQNTEKDLVKEVQAFKQTFSPGIADDLWRINNNGLESTAYGIMQQSAILGIVIVDDAGTVISRLGRILEEGEQVFYEQGERKHYKAGYLTDLFTVSFPVYYNNRGKELLVGHTHLYSGKEIVLSRIKYGFILIIINSIIKTLALWVIIWICTTRIIGRPVSHLTIVTKNLNPKEENFSFDKWSLKDSSLLKRSDEIGHLSRSFESMRIVLLERDQKLTQSSENLDRLNREISLWNQTLEKRVSEKSKQITSVLTAIRQGIFMISDKLRIDNLYSPFLEEILGTHEIAGKDPMELIFKKSNISSDDLNRLHSALLLSFNEDEVYFTLNASQLPTVLQNENKTIEMSWQNIVDKRGKTEKILVAARDISDMVLLKEQTKFQEVELTQIGELLAEDSSTIDHILEIGEEFVAENLRLIGQNQKHNSEDLKVIFINYHTLKGLSRESGLRQLSETLHTAESYCDSLRQGKAGWDQTRLQKDGQRVLKSLNDYSHLYREKLGRRKHESHEFSSQLLSTGLKLLESLKENQDLPKAASGISSFVTQLKSTLLVSSESFFKSVFSQTRLLAKDLGKEVPQIHMSGPSVHFTGKTTGVLRNIFIHLLRNAMDHGIEPAAERLACGKSQIGNLYLRTKKDGQGLHISFQDDGRGLCLEKIHLAGVSNNLTDPHETNPETIANLIFHDGLTTTREITKISGRGVGMQAIKNHVENLSGSFSLQLKEGQSPSLKTAMVEFIITIPEEAFIA